MVKEMKETEIGVIPSDWDILKLGDNCHIYRGGSPRPIQDYLTTADNGINWIKIGDVKAGDKYITSTEEKIIPEGVSMSREVKAGDFILSNSMSFGRPYILKINGCIHDGWLVIQDYQSSFDANYLYYLLSSEAVFAQYKKLAAGSGVQNLNKDIVTEVILPHPEKKEQIIIANALSSIDELINVLEKEIEKKKNIKFGVLQKYLSGEERLPGFTSKWDVKSIDELCVLVTKQTGFDYSAEIKPSLVQVNYNSTLPFIQNKDFEGYYINFDTDFYIPVSVAYKYPKILLDEVCLLISISGRIGNVALFNNDRTAFVGGAVGVAKFKNPDLVEWAMLYLLSPNGQKMIFENEKAGAQHNLTVEDVRNFLIPIPEKDERIAITSMMADIEKDICQLEEKLDKYKSLKTGMMNDLLTGKIRLV